MQIEEPKWAIELRSYLTEELNKIVKQITETNGNRTAIFIEHNEPDVIYVYWSKRYMINGDMYYVAGHKELCAKLDISQYNQKPNNPKLRRIQNSTIVNDVIAKYYSKITEELIKRNE